MTAQGLSPAIIRMLHDKMYEKRKVAALEIEKLVRAYVNDGSTEEIQQTIVVLSNEFAMSQNPHSRKGGLIGLAACAIALGNQKIQPYLESLLKPVLICTSDPDNRLRYFACESLYNVVKVSRADTLPYFNQLFDILSKSIEPFSSKRDCNGLITSTPITFLPPKGVWILAADPDPNVRNGSELLDRLLKDIVTETPVFDISAFVVLLRERLYTKNQFTRRFLVQWLTCVMSIPEIDIIAFLPEFLEALFPILGDSSKEISNMCQSTLGEILSRMDSSADKVDFINMTNIVIVHCQSSDPLIKETALVWIHGLIVLGGSIILPLSSGIISSVLPTLAYESSTHRTHIREKAEKADKSLMKLITSKYDKKGGNNENISLPLLEMIEVFSHYLASKSTLTKCAVLRWITHLLVQIPYSVFENIDKIFLSVMSGLCDPADVVVLSTLECLAEITSSPAGQPIAQEAVVGTRHSLHNVPPHSPDSPLVLNAYFSRFIKHLLLLFKSHKDLLETRSSFIIRQLCALLHPKNVFRALGQAITEESVCNEDPRFSAHVVKKLNGILMTSTEMAELRDKLKNSTSQEHSELFCGLYKSWCHSPVAAVTLCLLTQNYKHCCRLLQKLSDFDLTVEFLVELDKLVNLLESPIFSYLRLQLLETPHRQYLTKTMYSILMLLPQSRSFKTLHQRLNSVPNGNLLFESKKTGTFNDGDNLKDVDFEQLFQHFVAVQEKHAEYRKLKRLQVSS